MLILLYGRGSRGWREVTRLTSHSPCKYSSRSPPSSGWPSPLSSSCQNRGRSLDLPHASWLSLKPTCPLPPGHLSERRPVLSLPCFPPLGGPLAVETGSSESSVVVQVPRDWSQLLPQPRLSPRSLHKSHLGPLQMVPYSILTQTLGTWHSSFFVLDSTHYDL